MRRHPRHYYLLVMDDGGRRLRRLRCSRTALQIYGLGAAILLSISCGLLAHATWLRPRAATNAPLARENDDVRRALQAVRATLPPLRAAHLQAEWQFARLWAHSGLGRRAASAAAPVDPLRTAPPSCEAQPPPPDASVVLRRAQRQQLAIARTLEYFQEANAMLARTPSVRPVGLAWLSSAFGRRRDPLLGHWVIHKGLDLAGHLGDAVTAPADGVVIYTGRRGGYGLTVVLDHGNGLQTHYAHLQATHVTRGAQVRRGERLASMGSTGRSTGPHLHYEVRQHGEPQDPRHFILN